MLRVRCSSSVVLPSLVILESPLFAVLIYQNAVANAAIIIMVKKNSNGKTFLNVSDVPSSRSTWFYSHSSSVTQELLSFQFRNQESEVKGLVAQLCLIVWDRVDCSPPRSSVHGILQARILEWVAISFSRGSSQPRGWNWVSCIAGGLFTVGAIRRLSLNSSLFTGTCMCALGMTELELELVHAQLHS